MKKLVFNDGRNIPVQSVSAGEGVLRARIILTTSEQLKALFMDEFATRKMTVYENDVPKLSYENYDKLSYIKEEAGGIWEVEMLQKEASPAEKLKLMEIDISALGNQAENIASQITDLQMAMCELYEERMV